MTLDPLRSPALDKFLTVSENEVNLGCTSPQELKDARITVIMNGVLIRPTC